MTRFLVPATVLVALATLPVRAQSQRDLDETAQASFTKADRALNATYNALAARLEPDGKAALVTAERSWLRFRDDECTFETQLTLGGSMHGMAVVECQARLTRARTADLQRRIDHPDE